MIEHKPRRRSGFVTRLWRAFTTPSAHFSLGSVLLYGFFAGVIFWGGFHWSIELSNTETFCLSCHEMRSFVYPAVAQSRHYSNQSGVRAICTDCHVPNEWANKISTKFNATLTEVPGHVMGTIDTLEKYEARRLVLAERVWDIFVANDSLGCRNCHDSEYMDLGSQEGLAARQHQLAAERGVTCIACHKGVAHPLPAGAPDRQLIVDRR